ncbi:hybrid sensor histidine kinase/response regulator [Segetibacter koreensis]|uniref:hybrid sensor histidine kinase/response regulator n=1 Tax=Segetibacter koreensis TaxID=398037 RepID=UPI000361EECB|nr:hybrid sensor histidine kinase/response regulator [Segetibacter koreensis]
MSANNKKISILYIDDEEDNLLSFKATFRRNYDIFTATSSAQGLNILNNNTVHIIIADQRMPQSTGVEFFDIVRTAHPDPMRILLTGYTDVEAIIDAINKGQIFRYIKKPWDKLELQTSIKNAYEVYTTRQNLKIKIEELQRTNDELNRFVYSTSHDLRSPLASVMGVLNLAKMEGSVKDPNGYMGMIESCVNKMDFFIIKVIEYYKSVRVDEAYEIVDLKKLATDSIDLIRMQNRSIIFDLQVNQPEEFWSDAFRLSVILNNLISNAVKYQKPDECNPFVKLVIDVNQQEANILIEDNGVGIIEDHLNNIFKMFFRSNFTVTGLGIGLYIVKEALTRIGGDISVASTPGVGTSFLLKVPNMKPVRESE